ncbi:FtsX-like permease family protein [Saccharothrix algeriensis]|uniref:ABC transport system permease protein n=1 Tax=Saccharothrix algeriensis TaxID=173560 RepID=A0A8T8HYT8_9PSEU|nr:ABC transporter permease [Saccharothrix algeriensis]MBM7809481.1 putative ABC transport system permease protein [Saccharothrix algeriensis]QTR03813.1 ABC transporter permease [Saccharothrix algeriensis]
MPTSLRLAVAEFRNRPGRAVLPGIALVVGVACLLAALMTSDAMGKATRDGAPVVPADADLVVRAVPFTGAVIDQAVVDRVAAVPGVREVAPARRVEVDLLLAGGRAGADRAAADVEVDRPGLRRVPILEGRPPGHDGEIAVDRVTAFRHGLSPGGSIEVADAQGRPLAVVVRGITKRGGQGEQPAVVVGEGLAAELGGRPRILALHVMGGDAAAVAQAAGADLRVDPASAVRAEPGSDELSVVLLPFSILALATSVFVASATFRAVYAQRRRHTALLRCLGAHRGPLVWANLLEALVTGAVAGAVGAVLGGSVAWLLARLFDATGLSALLGAVELEPTLLPSAGHLVLGVVLAAALSAFAAVRPSLAATRVSPLAALRTSEGATPDAAVARRRRVLGLVLVAAAVGLAALGVLAAGSMAAIFLVLFSGITAVAGLFGVLGPVVVPALGRVFGAVASRVGGAQWKLAAAEVRRVPQRSASVAMPLLLAAAMVTYFAVTVGSAQRLEDEFSNEPRPDAVVLDAGDRPLGAAATAVVDRPEVERGVVLHTAVGTQTGPTDDSYPMTVEGVDADRMREWLADRGVERADFRPGAVLLTEYTARTMDAVVGQPVTLHGLPGGPRTATFAGTIAETLVHGAHAVLADESLAPASKVLVTLAPGADQTAFRDAVHASLGSAPTVLVQTRVDNAERNQRNLDLGITVLMVLLGLSVAVAVTGIGTALAISVQERRKELALRRALGVTRGGIQGGVVAEAVLLALVGVLGGGVFGLVYAELTLLAVKVYAPPTAALLPLLVGGAGVVVLAVLAAFGPARGASRIRPAAGLAAG